MPEPTIRQRPASEVAAEVALRLLGRAREALAHLGEAGADDPEALHDARVAVRRLRAWLRVQRPVLGGKGVAGATRLLRKVTRCTNERRDLEVAHALLSEMRGASGTPVQARQGLEVIRGLLEAEAPDGGGAGKVQRRFAEAAERLEGALAPPGRSGRKGRKGGRARALQAFGPHMSAVLHEERDRLRTRAADVTAADARKATHAARIATKRLRYVLEPLAGEIPAAAEAVVPLRRVQDLLGELHDLQAFLARASAAVNRAGASWTGAATASVLAGASVNDALPQEMAGALAALGEIRGRTERAFLALRDAWPASWRSLAAAVDATKVALEGEAPAPRRAEAGRSGAPGREAGTRIEAVDRESGRGGGTPAEPSRPGSHAPADAGEADASRSSPVPPSPVPPGPVPPSPVARTPVAPSGPFSPGPSPSRAWPGSPPPPPQPRGPQSRTPQPPTPQPPTQPSPESSPREPYPRESSPESSPHESSPRVPSPRVPSPRESSPRESAAGEEPAGAPRTGDAGSGGSHGGAPDVPATMNVAPADSHPARATGEDVPPEEDDRA